MVFMPTARSAGLLHELFTEMKLPYPVWEIHSRMSQSARTKATDAFRAAPEGVLFSSDVTARGIDVKGVTAVVQLGLPSSADQCESVCLSTSSSADPLRRPPTWKNSAGRSRRTWYPNIRRLRNTLLTRSNNLWPKTHSLPIHHL
jgi:hypothetical protein